MGNKPIDDLLTLFQTFVHGNVDSLTADPSIRLASDDDPDGTLTNGEVVLKEQFGPTNIDFGALRHQLYYISGYSFIKSTTNVQIMEIQDELLRLMNINNATKNTYKFKWSSGNRYNGHPAVGYVEWQVEANLKWVSAIT